MILTADRTIAADASKVFDSLVSGSFVPDPAKLLVSPLALRPQILSMIDDQIAVARSGGQGYVAAKINSLNDGTIIRKLIEASQAGVKVELVVRGICCIVAGVPGYTDNITVRSIVGRFLEHSRIFIFGAEGVSQKIYIGSADFMNRNTVRRVEVAAPIEDEKLKKRVREMFRAVRGFCFNTEPERDLAARLYGPKILSPDRPCGVVGFALPDFPSDPAAGRRLAGTDAPYIIYCGRRDPMKGTPLVIDYWAAWRACHPDVDLKLVLTGIGDIEVPANCRAHLIDLGDVADARQRHDLMAGAVAFCHASVNESLSIVLLESWLARRPVLVHANGVVLRAQTKRANGGLWFRDFVDFNECLEVLLRDPALADALGESGRAFTLAEYSPDAVRRRFLETLAR